MALLRALVASFYSRAFYREVATEWSVGRAVVLLAFALAVGWLVQVLALQRSMGAWAKDDAERVIAALPPLSLRGGELEASPPGPHTISLEEGDEPPLLVIDTSLAPAPPGDDVVVHVTRTRVSARRNAFETRSFDISEVVKSLNRPDGPIAPDELRAAVAALARWMPVFLYPFAVVGELAYRVLAALALAAVGVGFGRLAFGRLFVVSLAVLAPLVLAESLLSALGRPVSGWIAAPVAVALLAFAVRAAPASGAPDQPPGLPPPLV